MIFRVHFGCGRRFAAKQAFRRLLVSFGVIAGSVRSFQEDVKIHPYMLTGVIVLGVFLVFEATLGIVGTSQDQTCTPLSASLRAALPMHTSRHHAPLHIHTACHHASLHMHTACHHSSLPMHTSCHHPSLPMHTASLPLVVSRALPFIAPAHTSRHHSSLSLCTRRTSAWVHGTYLTGTVINSHGAQ
jgi:hypothetical protein